MAISRVQHNSMQVEEALSQGMEKLKQNLMDTLTAPAKFGWLCRRTISG
jgi:transcription factor TGA